LSESSHVSWLGISFFIDFFAEFFDLITLKACGLFGLPIFLCLLTFVRGVLNEVCAEVGNTFGNLITEVDGAVLRGLVSIEVAVLLG
jgi:hypothetical protein